ncbi:MAG: dihydropteroate synthase [Planctomycetota bacterium]
MEGHVTVWGVVNVTPDSFSDGGRHADTASALTHARALRRAGAEVLDIGGESTRPGAAPVPLDVEVDRVVPLVRALRDQGDDGLVSVDTRHPVVARAALAAGADIVNDVGGGRDPALLEVVAERGAGLVLMHMQGEPRTMQAAPTYGDVVSEVIAFLVAQAQAARALGIRRVWLDPGLGFGKTTRHNLQLLAGLERLVAEGPVLLGASRKRFLGELTDEPQADRRLAGSLAAAARGFEAGVDAVRVHDVRETRQLLDVLEAIRRHAGIGDGRAIG